jgi:Transposase domain (DUF772)
VRSPRGIERHCRDDVAFRVITGNQVPDHATMARFRARHEDAIGDLFGGVLARCNVIRALLGWTGGLNTPSLQGSRTKQRG